MNKISYLSDSITFSDLGYGDIFSTDNNYAYMKLHDKLNPGSVVNLENGEVFEMSDDVLVYRISSTITIKKEEK